MTLLSSFRTLFLAAAVAVATLLAAVAPALADKIHLKDGRVLDGRVSREGDGFVYFVVRAGGIENEQFFTSDQIVKIERDAAAAAAAALPPSTSQPTRSESSRGRATRVAILNFGPPNAWQGRSGDMVGMQIGSAAFERVVPLLEKDNVDVVVIRINSGGGYLLEIEKFHKLFQETYKKKFRTVAWVESAISAAAMSPWVIEEFYMKSDGSIGGCTGWSGDMVAVKGIELEGVLHLMERASAMANRSPYIMRAMQVLNAPLSADIDPVTGEVKWYQDETAGKILVNKASTILTFNAADAEMLKFSRGTADTKEDLARAMGLQEVEWAGLEATKLIDDFMMDATKFEKEMGSLFQKYQMAIAAAQALQGDQNRVRRGAEIGRARSYLREIRRLFGVNPNFGMLYGIDDEWFQNQERILRELAR